MMNSADLTTIYKLYGELQMLRAGRKALDNGARIAGFQLAGQSGTAPAMIVSDYMNYPAQMTDTIKSLMESRETAVVAELARWDFAESAFMESDR